MSGHGGEKMVSFGKRVALVTNELNEGLFTRYHKNGNLHDAGHYHASKKTGEWKFYNEDGSLKQKKIFK